ncbi:MAG: hypothetical protein VB916_05605 [Alphaproteobacteria bacterium]
MLDLNTNEKLTEENNIIEPDVIYSLEKAVKIGRLPLHSTTRWWNLSLDHQIIALLAIASKLNKLPLEYTMDNSTQSHVPMRVVHNICSASHTTIQKIVSDGIFRKELVPIKPKNGDRRHSLFTASEMLINNFELTMNTN